MDSTNGLPCPPASRGICLVPGRHLRKMGGGQVELRSESSSSSPSLLDSCVPLPKVLWGGILLYLLFSLEHR